ncbi:hypothetical protein [Novosphingobium sp. fls2-241-R2A-195]|uniref:hypothetical protein n=1 Tax=Novosphingobium sp. fls2-241-R2A-195 TaxID=3040296 RepID=UPI00254E8C8D|nr:hypothetical protein [Novosphingobium sp. fls2-241-R2A-195]
MNEYAFLALPAVRAAFLPAVPRARARPSYSVAIKLASFGERKPAAAKKSPHMDSDATIAVIAALAAAVDDIHAVIGDAISSAVPADQHFNLAVRLVE